MMDNERETSKTRQSDAIKRTAPMDKTTLNALSRHSQMIGYLAGIINRFNAHVEPFYERDAVAEFGG